jgi:crotonobetainyl-CoA:carnitine CoA-transferase CaiB-like acyl-CoA transferase
VFEAADGRHLTLGALEPRFWQNLCRLIGREDLVSRQHAQGAERDRMESELRAIFRTRPRDEWVRLLHTEDVCAGPVSTLDEVVRDPQFRARGLFQEVRHPRLGPVPQVACPVKLSDAPGRMAAPPPELGQHTDELLRELGYDADAIAALRRDGAL